MKLTHEVLEQVKAVQTLIGLKELELVALKSLVATLLRVDISTGDWVLDTDSGELHEEGPNE